MDSAWAHKRRARTTLILVAVGVLLLFIYLQVGLYERPTCRDGIQNQDELGVDCGGPCARVCTWQVGHLQLLWTRAFEVSPSVYTLLAYGDNPNFDAYSNRAPYRYALYDKDNFLITEGSGETFVTGDPTTPVFIGPIDTQGARPARVFFEWSEVPSWYSVKRRYTVTVEEREITSPNFGAEVTAVLQSKEPVELKNIEVTLIVYDDENNAIAASETFVDYLGPRQSRRLVFNWPQPFPKTAARLEFIPRVPDQTGL